MIDPDTGNLVNRMIYVPDYQNHTAPLGVWIIKGFAIPNQYNVDPKDEAYDYGIVLAAPISGKTLVEDVGGRNIEFNTDPSTITYDAFGYPAEDPFDGETMQSCSSTVTTRDDAFTPAPLGMSCDMNEGASGGGWIDHATGSLNSNVGYGKSNVPNVDFGPYLDSDAQTLFEGAEQSDIAGPLPSQSPPASPPSVTAPIDSTPPVVSHVVAKPAVFRATSCKPSSTHFTKLSWSMNEPSVHTTVTIRTPKGLLTATIDSLLLQGGWYFPWNGCDARGKLEPAGNYKFTVRTVDISGNASRGVSNTVTLKR